VKYCLMPIVLNLTLVKKSQFLTSLSRYCELVNPFLDIKVYVLFLKFHDLVDHENEYPTNINDAI